jgi:uncharacterized phage protein (TIGR02220 family)
MFPLAHKVGDKVPGWIKLHRQLLESTVFDNSDLLKVWVWCLLKATHRKRKQLVGLQEVMLEEGQFIFGRKKASEELKLSESKVYRLMKILKSENNISMKSNNKFTIITVENWTLYQGDDKENEQQMNNKRTTNEQQMNTNKNVKNVKNIYIYIVEYLNEKTKKNFKYTTKKTKSLIDARLKEGFSLEDFKKVIDIKIEQWLNDKKMNSYLRPETLFGNKFEGYLNESTNPKDDGPDDDPYAGMKVYTGGE